MSQSGNILHLYVEVRSVPEEEKEFGGGVEGIHPLVLQGPDILPQSQHTPSHSTCTCTSTPSPASMSPGGVHKIGGSSPSLTPSKVTSHRELSRPDRQDSRRVCVCTSIEGRVGPDLSDQQRPPSSVLAAACPASPIATSWALGNTTAPSVSSLMLSLCDSMETKTNGKILPSHNNPHHTHSTHSYPNAFTVHIPHPRHLPTLPL
ncbi:hypothetical protein J4Q44_G00358530 [Coregonus suidteri]|uniref:Uncharacterized protein n=1 Tax=Coregonus suidteri TaxID=861788 RepID=A0AAN8QL28_9TELE